MSVENVARRCPVCGGCLVMDDQIMSVVCSACAYKELDGRKEASGCGKHYCSCGAEIAEGDKCAACVVDDSIHGPSSSQTKTLRDEFAMAAMGCMNAGEVQDYCGTEDLVPKQLALNAYEIADAMLEAREQ